MPYANPITRRSKDRQRQARLRAERKAAGNCIDCGRPALALKNGKLGCRCAKCKAKAAAQSNGYLARLRPHCKKLRICVVCLKREAMKGKTKCGYCDEKQEEYEERRKEKKNATA